MSGFNFGRAFSYQFHANDANGEKLDLTDAVFDSAYVFSSKPGRDAAIAGTGAIQTIADWDIPTGEVYATLAVIEIEDPEPTALFKVYEYYIAINFKFAAGGQVQTIVKELPIERITAQQSAIGVTYTDVLKHFPLLSRYFSNVNDITNLIEVTEEEIKVYLSGAGFQWAQIWHPKSLFSAVKFKVLANICLMQSIDSGDEWQNKHSEYMNYYRSVIDSTKLEYDLNNAGDISQKQSMSSFQRIIR